MQLSSTLKMDEGKSPQAIIIDAAVVQFLFGLYGKVFTLGFFRTDLVSSSLGLYENHRQILSRMDLTLS